MTKRLLMLAAAGLLLIASCAPTETAPTPQTDDTTGASHNVHHEPEDLEDGQDE